MRSRLKHQLVRYVAAARRRAGTLRLRWIAQNNTRHRGRDDVGEVDYPFTGEVLRSRVLPVRGWVRLESGVDHILIRVDGHAAGRARLLAGRRPDLAAAFPDADAPLGGWECLIPLDTAEAGILEVSAIAVTAGGNKILGVRRVEFDPCPRRATDPSRILDLARRNGELARSAKANPDTLLVATHHLGLGGGQLYLHELLRLIRDKYSVTVLSSADGELREELEDWGVDVHVVGYPPVNGHDYEQWMSRVLTIALSKCPEAIIANTAGSYWGVDLASRCGRPSIWAIHESFTPETFTTIGFAGDPDEHVRARFFAAFQAVSKCVFEADATAALFAGHLPADSSTRIDYGIDLHQIESRLRELDRGLLRESLGISEDAEVLLSVGTYEPRKAQGLLLIAFARIVREFPNSMLVLIGDYPSDFSEGVHEVAERLDIASQVRLIPVTSHLDDWYVASDAYVMASDIESLPRSMMEAMAFGLPVIAPSVFGIPEMITDGADGLLFEAGSVGALTEVLRRFLGQPAEEQRRLADSGRELVLATRSSSDYAAAYSELIRTLRRPGRRINPSC